MLRRRWVLMLAAGAVVAAAGALGGCSDPLRTKTAPQSPYERYNMLHGDSYQPPPDHTIGYERHDLRRRLRPLDQP